LLKNFLLIKKFFQKQTLELEIPILEKFENKIKILSIHNIFHHKFAAACPQTSNATLCLCDHSIRWIYDDDDDDD